MFNGYHLADPYYFYLGKIRVFLLNLSPANLAIKLKKVVNCEHFASRNGHYLSQSRMLELDDRVLCSHRDEPSGRELGTLQPICPSTGQHIHTRANTSYHLSRKCSCAELFASIQQSLANI